MLEKKKYIIKIKNILLNRNDPLLFFIQRLRDEAHRFAISTHRAKRKKNFNKSLIRSNFKELENKEKELY
jgi:excinuclease UvrABC nuclease subunit